MRVRYDDIIEGETKKYGISFSATSLRYTSVGLHPIMVVYSFKNKIKWYWSSHDFSFKQLLNGKNKLPEDTVAGEYFLKGFYPKSSEEVWVIDWLADVSKWDIQRKLREQYKVHENHCVSIIWEV